LEKIKAIKSLNNIDDDVWLAYQLNRPKENDGIIIAFRRNNCPDDSITVKLRGVDKNAEYELIDVDSGKKTIQKGGVLINGFTLSLAEKEKSLQINYQKVEK
jgi:alpha-galactosidase